MADDIIRPTPMYRQVAERLADEIAQGVYAPGKVLPSETQLMERYGVSRPTVRAAVAELRNLGLVESQHGKGSFVRRRTEPTATIDQSITRAGRKYHAHERQFTEVEDCQITRTHTAGTEAVLLQREDAAAFTVERLLLDPGTGLRVTHRTVIPFDVADEIPELAEHPDTHPADIYALLTAAGHTITWADDISARPAKPDERTTLRATDPAILLVVHRVTVDSNGHPLILEVFATSADQARFAYPHSAGRAPARRSD
ncbi:GntR family transcriptional regulator [Actinacidiphila sp. DG2A-62]|uniref:GntR family transcriptional regulator n=1 Tax=Actinacidiphila sp. DG2A-62 TaxID=3108821 RepID=UPI002DB6BC40|nr:GntR family transcriptional regulator [Actinacidiphila sp. DG2A-62]MEC3996766.1 GntR family transcriptional regulator [Actinacidiphila sp. DG2A-62]